MSAAAVRSVTSLRAASRAARAAARGLRSVPVTSCPCRARPAAGVPMPQEQSRTAAPARPGSASRARPCRRTLASPSAWIRWWSSASSSEKRRVTEVSDMTGHC
ncbi:hypothetical protein AQJ64_33000 [Streptomyces griseoruber]|uniref:Uncharacterized protein n=1 Tax=Streptomyces griseoruber TaxID=1943 RepID=A0A101SQD1_9ACTN|nr:hypothetical protein AQJ64_33000 [Streptomyces griseoruber]